MTERRQPMNCPNCGSYNEFRVNLATGNALITYPAKCPTKDECAARISKGYVWMPLDVTSPAPVPDKLTCIDCGLSYSSDKWCDCVVSDEIWARIAPEPCVLCFNCMTARAAALGMEKVPITIRSGPWLLAWDDSGQRELNTRLQERNKMLEKRIADLVGERNQ